MGGGGGGGEGGGDVFDAGDQAFPLTRQAHISLRNARALASVERSGGFSLG